MSGTEGKLANGEGQWWGNSDSGRVTLRVCLFNIMFLCDIYTICLFYRTYNNDYALNMFNTSGEFYCGFYLVTL